LGGLRSDEQFPEADNAGPYNNYGLSFLLAQAVRWHWWLLGLFWCDAVRFSFHSEKCYASYVQTTLQVPAAKRALVTVVWH